VKARFDPTQTENSGDPFHDYSNGQDLPYWKAFYWLLVTMSTVGYGDVNPATDITKAFIILFIMGSFVGGTPNCFHAVSHC
jgi:potassium large conductance calcium-activated channel subfamily M alpha protein 1